jgi:hypothetical protein
MRLTLPTRTIALTCARMHPSTAAYLARFPDDPEAPGKDVGGKNGLNVVGTRLGRGGPNAVTGARRGCSLPELPRLNANEGTGLNFGPPTADI